MKQLIVQKLNLYSQSLLPSKRCADHKCMILRALVLSANSTLVFSFVTVTFVFVFAVVLVTVTVRFVVTV